MTGSRIAAAVGLSPYSAPIDVYRDLVEGREIAETPAMKRGRLLERAVLEWFAEDTGASLSLDPGTRTHPVHTRIGATPDALAIVGAERGVVEAKTANIHTADKWGLDGTDDIPRHYLCQVQLEMGVTGFHVGWVPTLIGGDDFRIFRVAFDEEFFGMLVEAGERFLRDYVDTGTPPPVDASDSYANWMDGRFPVRTKELVAATPEIDGVLVDYREAMQQLDAAEERKALAANRLKAFAGGSGGIRGAAGTVKILAVKGRERTNWEAVAKEAALPGDLITKHTARGAGHVQLRFSTNKENGQYDSDGPRPIQPGEH